MKRKTVNMLTGFLYVFFYIIIVSDIFSMESNEKSNSKVLILDFANISNSTEYQYLKTSVPESFSASLSKLQKFQILDRNIWNDEVSKGHYSSKNAFDQKTALLIAKKYKADMVIIGGFVVNKGQVQIFAKTIEVSTEKIIVNNKAESGLDGNLFSSISKFSDEMAAEMGGKKSLTSMYLAVSSPLENEVSSLIYTGLMENRSRIYEKSANLSKDERESLYYQNRKEAGTAFVLNFLFGFGLGSFVQGDTSGGLVGLYGDLGSVGVMIAGFALQDKSTGGIVAGIGGLAFLGFRIFEMIRPVSYTDAYNKRLGESLRVSVAVIPYINIAQNGYATYGIGFSTKF